MLQWKESSCAKSYLTLLQHRVLTVSLSISLCPLWPFSVFSVVNLLTLPLVPPPKQLVRPETSPSVSAAITNSPSAPTANGLQPCFPSSEYSSSTRLPQTSAETPSAKDSRGSSTGPC